MNDGGPAFPRPSNEITEGCSGMSLRDWFAGQAIIGIVTHYGSGNCDSELMNWPMR